MTKIMGGMNMEEKKEEKREFKDPLRHIVEIVLIVAVIAAVAFFMFYPDISEEQAKEATEKMRPWTIPTRTTDEETEDAEEAITSSDNAETAEEIAAEESAEGTDANAEKSIAPEAGKVSLRGCFVVQTKDDEHGVLKDVDDSSLKGLMRDAHYFDFGEMSTWVLGTYAGSMAVEMTYPQPIKLNGNNATLYDDEIRLALRMSDDKETISDNQTCVNFIDLVTFIQGEKVQSLIIVRRGDAYYRYKSETKEFSPRNLVMNCTDVESGFSWTVSYPFMLERGAFKTLVKIVKKGAYREDCPFETIGVEYETLDEYAFD